MIGDARLRIRPAPEARQIDILFDDRSYSAFPHVVQLDREELLIAFRQAPRQSVIRHTHPRSIITVMRSYDLGASWDVDNATQLAAGGGQEFSMLYLGKGVVAGALAKHGVAPMAEDARAGFPAQNHEYPFGLNGGYWAVIVELAPGHLLCLHRTEGNKVGPAGTFWRNESFDGGLTWTAPEDADIKSGACPRLLKVTDGRVLLTFGRRYEPYGIRAMLSHDGGRTWGDTAWVVRQMSNWDQGYTSSIQLGNGSIFTVSYGQNTTGITGITGAWWGLP